jgi:hypothetical protein
MKWPLRAEIPRTLQKKQESAPDPVLLAEPVVVHHLPVSWCPSLAKFKQTLLEISQLLHYRRYERWSKRAFMKT